MRSNGLCHATSIRILKVHAVPGTVLPILKAKPLPCRSRKTRLDSRKHGLIVSGTRDPRMQGHIDKHDSSPGLAQALQTRTHV